MNLYELLGVIPSQSTADDIHAAYRRAARFAHPDIVGGDADEFARLKLAHDVLTDPDRRAHYDRTGQFEQNAADNVQAELLTLLAGAFDDACNGVLQAQEDLTLVDLVQRMRGALQKRSDELHHSMEEAAKAIEIFSPLIGRFSSAVIDEPNLLDSIVRQKITSAEEFQTRAAADIGRISAASEFLVRYRYRSDPLPERTPYIYAHATGPALDFMRQLEERNSQHS